MWNSIQCMWQNPFFLVLNREDKFYCRFSQIPHSRMSVGGQVGSQDSGLAIYFQRPGIWKWYSGIVGIVNQLFTVIGSFSFSIFWPYTYLFFISWVYGYLFGMPQRKKYFFIFSTDLRAHWILKGKKSPPKQHYYTAYGIFVEHKLIASCDTSVCKYTNQSQMI